MRGPEIVITGSALTTSLGTTRDQTWRAILNGQCGIGPMSEMETPLPPGSDGGQAMDLPTDFSPDLSREARYLKWTIDHALRDAGLWQNLPDRTGVMLGTTLHGMRAAGQFLRTSDPAPLRHFLAGSILNLAIRDLPITGLCATTCSACSSSLGAIALAVTLLQSGQLDCLIAGGYDPISEYAYAGFNSLRLVAAGPLRPFSRHRQGMKLAEGYGILILQRREDAEKLGASIHATIAGFGESADAHHLTQPHPQGRGATRAMSLALQSANIDPSQIHLISAHATATPDNDAGEYAALSSTFTENLSHIPVVAFKSHLGHTLGGAGAVELILASCALRDQQIPPCPNSTRDEIEFPNLNLSLQSQPQPPKIENTLNTSLGFGGANTCMVLSSNPAPIKKLDLHPVAITGIGIILPGITGNEAFIKHLASPPNTLQTQIPESQYQHLLNARRVRRMSEYVKLSLAAANLACKDAGVAEHTDFLRECSVLLGTTHSSTNFATQYYRDLVSQGLIGANPTFFAEGVPNAAAAHLSLMLGIQGACQTIIGTRTAGLDALNLAVLRIAAGNWPSAIVGAAEEQSDVLNQAYRSCGLCASNETALPFTTEPGFIAGAASVCFLLENTSLAQQQGRRIYGHIEASATAHRDPSHIPEAWCTILPQLRPPQQVLSSANATWIDRAEQSAIAREYRGVPITSLYGPIAESFSATALADIAAALLGAFPPENTRFTSLCTDYSGSVTATSFNRLIQS